MKDKIVISAVNLVNGGPLTILKKCLEALSLYALIRDIEVIALVHNKELCDCPNIIYIEVPWAKTSWLNRVYCEYFYFRKLSLKLKPKLWLSLHDMTPNVISTIRAVYCHNPTPFYKPSIKDIKYNYKEFLFSLFYRYLYQVNIHRNNYVIVQQNWLRDSFAKMFSLKKENLIVAKPVEDKDDYKFSDKRKISEFTFSFPAFPRTFKNFEVICKACAILEKKGINNYRVMLTLSGTENAYAKHVYQTYKHLKTVSFCGILSKEQMVSMYEETDCLIFPSKLETWGLPISEFIPLERPMLIADLPYAYETAIGANQVCFFDPCNPEELAVRMVNAIENDYSCFSTVSDTESNADTITSWEELFDRLLKPNA